MNVSRWRRVALSYLLLAEPHVCGGQQLVLGAELRVQRLGCDSSVGGDRLEPDVLVGMAGEVLPRGGEQALAGSCRSFGSCRHSVWALLDRKSTRLNSSHLV